MLLPLIAALILSGAAQTPTTDRAAAESLARAGRSADALAIFTRIVEANPSDIEARLWKARMELRLGRVEEAEAGFRSVLREHPADVDATIGLASVLLRTGAWEEALAHLREAQPAAGENADFFAAYGRALRRSGDDRQALEYLRRARRLSPNDPDITLGYEAVARNYGHWIGIEGFGQWGAPGAKQGSGAITADVRVAPRLHLDARARVQTGDGYDDALGGGGFLWRVARATTTSIHAFGGSGNVSLPTSDLSADVTHYAGVIEIGGLVRRLSFEGARVGTASPTLAWIPTDHWRTDARYTYSRSWFDQTGQSSGDHSVMLRETWQAWPRAALMGGYAYGIESFENLTADRLDSLGSTTVFAGFRIDVPSLTRITTTWEQQWRSNDSRINRVTLSLVQAIP